MNLTGEQLQGATDRARDRMAAAMGDEPAAEFGADQARLMFAGTGLPANGALFVINATADSKLRTLVRAGVPIDLWLRGVILETFLIAVEIGREVERRAVAP